ncbi:MAG: hypothetical protein AAGJ35_08295, partial [Myxococcota bacterium]
HNHDLDAIYADLKSQEIQHPHLTAETLKPPSPKQRFVICLDNTDHPTQLIVRKLYTVIPDSTATQYLRIIDESGTDNLYPASLFADALLTENATQTLIAQHDSPAKNATASS